MQESDSVSLQMHRTRTRQHISIQARDTLSGGWHCTKADIKISKWVSGDSRGPTGGHRHPGSPMCLLAVHQSQSWHQSSTREEAQRSHGHAQLGPQSGV